MHSPSYPDLAKPLRRPSSVLFGSVFACFSLLALSGCGGGVDGSAPNLAPDVAFDAAPTDAVSSASLHFDVELPAELQQQIARPYFHAAPVILAEPSDEDARGESRSAWHGPSTFYIRGNRVQSITRNMTPQALVGTAPAQLSLAAAPPSDLAIASSANGFPAASFTPAQIRAAYQLPALPTSWTGLSASQAAQYGAGQTIYIVDAHDDPNAAAELAAFNAKFGLPGCTSLAIAPTTKLPLAPPSPTSGCTFSVVYNTSNGGMTSTAPAYNSGWAMEIALDVQWAHAIAPMARIVLIEAAGPTLGDLLGAVNLANAMGPGVVSMSFGGNEGSWTTSVDSAFAASGMTYLAATGDNGNGVSWPAVSANVVAVGGTTLAYSGSGARSETTWSGSGGGTSAYVATPSYQTNQTPGLGSRGRRSVADVSMNADPYTGQMVVTMAPGSTTGKWMSVGGTSLSTPQWAGLTAIINANRALAARSPLGDAHAAIYALAAVPGTYSANFLDISTGSNGSCATCAASAGYDTPTGLGTPNFARLLTDLSGSAATASPPVVSGVNVSGVTGSAFTFTTAATSTNAVTWAISGGPTGMTIAAATGVVTWSNPTAGTWSVVATATDSKTGLAGKGTYNVTITAPVPPVVAAITVSGTAGKALSFTATATGANPVTWSIASAPTGMSIAASTGVVTWATPTAGTFKPVVTAKDNKTGASGQVTATVTIGAAAVAPVVAAANITGTVGNALSYTATATSTNAVTWTIASAPTGMTIGAGTGVISWAAPTVGTFKPVLTATDSKTGLTGQVTASVTISASSAATAPVVAAITVSGTAGKALSYTATATSTNAVTWSIASAPSGMAIAATTGVITWATPTVGTYKPVVTAKDEKSGLTGQVSATITIAAAPVAPTVAAATLTGQTDKVFSYTGKATATNPVTWSARGMPSGVAVSADGVLTWSKPTLGDYTTTLIAMDTKTGLSGSGLVSFKIVGPGPSIVAPAMFGVAGSTISGTIDVSNPGVMYMSVGISNIPKGMQIKAGYGLHFDVSWPAAVAGKYALSVSVQDTLGRTATASVPVTVTAK